MRRVVGPVVVGFLAVTLVARCSSGSGSSDTADDSVVVDHSVVVGDAGAGAGEQEAVGAPAAVDRQVVTSGSVGIVVEDPATAAQEASELVEAAGGRVDERVEQAASSDQEPSAHLVVRIPAEELTATLDQLKALGKVDRVQITATDVTDTAQDLDARVSALTVSVGRLEALMGTATSSDDLLALESALSARQADLEALQAQRAGLAGQVALATITLDLAPTPTVLAGGGPDGFWPGLLAGWGALTTTLGVLVIAIGVVLPWLAFLGVLGVATVVLIRFVQAHRRPAAAAAGDLGSDPS